MTESLMDRFGLDDKTKEFAKNVFRKAKNSKRSIDDDFKEVAKLIGFEQTIAQSLSADSSKSSKQMVGRPMNYNLNFSLELRKD